MGLLMYPVFKPSLRGVDCKTTGEILAREFQTLDKIAKEYRVTPLTAFADNREVPEGFDGPPDELEEILGEWDEWFDAGAGHKAFTDLAELIRRDSKVAKKLEEPEAVVKELENLARIVGIAAKKGAKFRLELS